MITRRTFVGAAAGAAVGAMWVRAKGAPAGAADALGQGAYRYRVVPGWGVLDAETPVKDCHGMIQAADGRIVLLTNHTKNNVVIYDRGGRLLGKWGTAWPGAHGLTLFRERGEERLFVTDHDLHQVFKVTLDGTVLMTLGWPADGGKYASAAQFKPTHVAVADDGSFYVADGYGRSHVLHYDPAGKLVKVFGGDTGGPDALQCAHGIHIDRRDPARPVLMVTSRSQHAIKRFSLDGAYLDTVALTGAMPCFMIPWGDRIVVPHLKGAAAPAGSKVPNGFVSILDRENRILANLAADAPAYDAEGRLKPMAASGTLFTYPHGLLVDDEESLYVAQWNSGGTYPIKLERTR